jgi:regulator of protease activity HflC (stomatin/prohibitin superfamily)
MKKRISAAKAFHQNAQESSIQPEIQLDTLDAGELSFEEEQQSGSSPMSAPASIRKYKKVNQNDSHQNVMVSSEELQLEKEPIKVRESGFWPWKRVIVPPNVYVVHTRLGRDKPVTLGLGESFRYNPYKDAYLIVPAAMQTIGIVAKCVTKEKQGINILAYLQWRINDFSIAYKALDMSDQRDPLGIVNAQLGEQADAAIKDKIATMTVEEALTDKAIIIDELTKRLESVTEGHNQDENTTGLGIKIVTVQIREAVVSSQKLWQDLQAPFRYQQEKLARISQLTVQNEVHKKELESRQLKETSEAETLAAIEQVKQTKQTEALTLRFAEESIRSSKEKEAHNQQKTLETEQALHTIFEKTRLDNANIEAEQRRLEQESLLKKQIAALNLQIQEQEDLLKAKALEAALTRSQERHQAKIAFKEAQNKLKMLIREQETEIARTEQAIRNETNEYDLFRRLIDNSADIAAQMPDIQELKILKTGDSEMNLDAFSTFIAKILAVSEHLGIPLKLNKTVSKNLTD